MTASSISSDGELVARSLRGESEAFGELYDRYFSAVYDFLHRTMRNSEEAADVAQETFLRAMESLGSLSNPVAFKSWLFTIAHHRALNRLEKQKRFVIPPDTDAYGEEADPLLSQVDVDRLANPEQAAEMKETARLVWEAASSLDRRTYAVLDLHVRQGLESAEIAEVLGVSKGNAYTMLNRMKRSLEEAIGSYLLMRRGSKKCEVLQSIVAPFAIPPVTMEMRKTVERHVRKCDTCRESRRTLMAPLAVFGAFACVPAPAGLRESIWTNLSAQWTQSGPPSYGSNTPIGKSSSFGRGGGGDGKGAGDGLSPLPIGGRRFALAMGAVLVAALVPLFLIMSISLPGNESVSTGLATITKRPATITRAATRTPSPTKSGTRTVTPAPTAQTTATIVPSLPPPAFIVTPTLPHRTPTIVLPTTGPVVRPTATPRPSRTPFPSHTPRPTHTPEPTIPFLQ
jgi:RNA polymerase sigma factor (sigma-70 family)